MGPEAVVGLFSQALWMIVVFVSAIIVPSLLVGLIVAVFQAATQINEQTLSFLPRLLATIFAIVVFGPWMVQSMIDHFDQILMAIPGIVG